MAIPSVEGVFKEWEASEEVRDHLRLTKTLFACEPRSNEAKCNVPCGERNFALLKPIAKRLRLPDDTVGQLRVPDISKEIFA